MCWCSRSVVDAYGPVRVRPTHKHVTECDWLQSDVAGREYSNNVFCIWTIMLKNLEGDFFLIAYVLTFYIEVNRNSSTHFHIWPACAGHLLTVLQGHPCSTPPEPTNGGYSDSHCTSINICTTLLLCCLGPRMGSQSVLIWSGATHSHFERSGKLIYIVHSYMTNKPMMTYVSWSI